MFSTSSDLALLPRSARTAHLIFLRKGNVQQRPIVEINVVDPVARKGYRFKGPATVYEEGPLFEEALAFYRHRGTTSTIRHIVLVKVERAMPLISPAYDQGKTEDEIRDTWLRYWGALYHLNSEEARDRSSGSTQLSSSNINSE